MLSNRPEFLYAWFGLAKIVAVMVPINTGFKESEAGYVANHSEAVGSIVDDEFLPTARAIKKEISTLKWIARVGGVPEDGIIPFGRFLQVMNKSLMGPLRIWSLIKRDWSMKISVKDNARLTVNGRYCIHCSVEYRGR